MPNRTPPRAVSTKAAPAAVGPYSQGIITGNLLFISGQIPMDPASGQLVTGPIEEMTHRVLRNMDAVCEAAGASLRDVVKVTVFLKDMKHFQAVNTIYEQYFPSTPPARSAVQVGSLPKNAEIEMEAVVQLPV